MRLYPLALSAFLVAALSITGCKKKPADMPVSTINSATSSSVETAATNGNTVTPAQSSSSSTFDINTVPVSKVMLPPFPYLDYPEKLENGYRHNNKDSDFDEVQLIAGRDIRKVEGKVSRRFYPHTTIGMSATGSVKNYENAIKSLGGAKVNEIMPADPAFLKLHTEDESTLAKKMHLPGIRNGGQNYQVYLLRTDKTNIWFIVSIFDDESSTWLVTVEEKALEQSVGLVKADAMAASLQTQGHITLYLSFDTDSDVIKTDSKPVVDEIVKLLRADEKLQLNIEGHTDNVGAAAHNKTLSQARAQAVVKAITSQGINPTRLNAIGMGAERPLQDNSSEAGRAKNRRVELVKLK